jgi:hypothetical protein
MNRRSTHLQAGDRHDVVIARDESIHLHVSIDLLNGLLDDRAVLRPLLVRNADRSFELGRSGDDEGIAEAGDDGREVGSIRVLQIDRGRGMMSKGRMMKCGRRKKKTNAVDRVVVIAKEIDEQPSDDRPGCAVLDVRASRDRTDDALEKIRQMNRFERTI